MPKKVTKLKRVDTTKESGMNILTRLAINTVALLVVAYLLPGFLFRDLTSAIVAAVVIGAANTYIRPILQIIALPITLITFGIGAFVVNVLLLWGVSLVVPGFEIVDFWTAALASILLTLISWFLHSLAKK